MYNAWADALNAHLYEHYAQTYPIYRATGSLLVALAGVRAGMTVVDLACGTGIVTEQLSWALSGTGTLIAVDSSAAMLAVATHKFPAARIRFLHSPAETIDGLLPEASVDVIVCNSAFWQTRIQDTLRALQRILKSGARFLFNFSLARFSDIPPPTAVLPALMVRIAQEQYGYVVPRRPQPRSKWTAEEIQHLLQGPSWRLVLWEDILFEETIQEAYAFFHIPVMTEVYLPGLDYGTRLNIVDHAYQQFKAFSRDRSVWRYAWRYYILEKN